MVLKPFSSVREVSSLQDEKASSPMVFTLPGTVRVVMPSQLMKAFLPMVFTVRGMVTDVMSQP